MEKGNFIFFWGNSSPYSQWHKRDMIIDNKKFSCCEQWMMYSKAILFKDYIIADKIMSTTNPKEHKYLGRQVKNFNSKIWDDNCREIVFKGNFAKFSQHEDLKRMLLSTGDKFHVESSPYDRIWGIGLAEDDPRAMDKSQWLGTNWLGQAIDRVREELRK